MYYICVLQKFRENQFHDIFFFGSDRLLKYLDCKKKEKKRKIPEIILKLWQSVHKMALTVSSSFNEQ